MTGVARPPKPRRSRAAPAPARRYAAGAEALAKGGARFRVWAPRWNGVELLLEGGPGGSGQSPTAIDLEPEPAADGWFSARVAEAGPGTLYRFRVGGDALPDPASRFQPRGVYGPSEVVDPGSFAWTDRDWQGVRLRGAVLYELHVGTFTREGTYEAAARELPALAELGITAVELMPLAEFAGDFGWGYDGVHWYAPFHAYGRPDDLRRFVGRAHGLGIGVLLDVVYNHFGPRGDHAGAFSDRYRSKRKQTEWGPALNFDEPGSDVVRGFVLDNAAMWVEEYHVDGLRLDAAQELKRGTDGPILAAIARRVREAARGRATLVIGECEPNESHMARPAERGGDGLDALWSNDFHHVATHALTGRGEGYFGDYRGSPQEFVGLWRRGFLYQGQWNKRQGRRRGEPTAGLAPEQFVTFLQNHDQVANSLRGLRFHALGPAALARALTAVWLLGPGTPLLFQGQEFASSAPFHYFSDVGDDLADEIRDQRRKFLEQFPSLKLAETQAILPDPMDPATFERSKLDPAERAARPEWTALHRDLLRLRRDDPTLRLRGSTGLDGAVLDGRAFVLRAFGPDGDDRIVVANLGDQLMYTPVSEPLLAPPAGRNWAMLWSSEAPAYGGDGTPPVETGEGWALPARSAVLFAAERAEVPGGSRDGDR